MFVMNKEENIKQIIMGIKKCLYEEESNIDEMVMKFVDELKKIDEDNYFKILKRNLSKNEYETLIEKNI